MSINGDSPLAEADFYYAGPLREPQSRLYIERMADSRVIKLLKQHDCVIVSEPKKQGKTSLIEHVRNHPELQQMHFVYISLLTDIYTIRSEQDWYKRLCRDVKDQLVQKIPEVKSVRIAKDHETWIRFVARIGGYVAQDQCVVIIVDEIQATSSEIFSRFFLAIKHIFNAARNSNSHLKRVNFLLAGTFLPSQLIQEAHHPGQRFDIGEQVRLDDLTLDGLEHLMCAGGLEAPASSKLPEYVYKWTAGQPFYVQWLYSRLHPGATEEDVDLAAESLMRRELIDHFKSMIDHVKARAREYRPVIVALCQSEPSALEACHDGAIADLELMGLLKSCGKGKYCFRNKFWQRQLSEIIWDEGLIAPVTTPAGRPQVTADSVDEELKHRGTAPVRALRLRDVTADSVDEELKHQQKVLAALEGRLRDLERMQASEGAFKDPKIQIEKEEVREKISTVTHSLSQPNPITLEFRPEEGATTITWRSNLLGREETRFVSPYDIAALPAVIRALNVLQYAYYPDAKNDQEQDLFTFSDEEQALLGAHGLWRDDRVAHDAPQIIGHALYAGLDAKGQDLIKNVRNIAISQRLRLSYVFRFPPQAIALAALPWELLWDKVNNQSIFVRGATMDSCERYMDLERAIPPPLPVNARPLLLALLPRYGISEVTRDGESYARLKTWRALKEQDKIEFVEMNHVTRARLNDEFPPGSRRPDIIHYYGHGTYRDHKGYLCFDREYGDEEPDLVSTEQLSALLGDIRLIVLHACESARVDVRDSLLTGIAPALSLVADAVVAMQLTVSTTVATRFLEVFYQGLLRSGLSLQEAVAEARRVLFTETIRDNGWYVPTLYIRSHEQKPMHLIPQD